MNTLSAILRARPLCQVIDDKWMLCLAVSFLALVATGWPEGLGQLRYDRSGMANGELWRVVSAHLVHLNPYHLLINLFGLALICELQWGAMPLRHGFGLLGFSGVAVDMALWCLQPDLQWYAGLSGVLHGLWAGCALFGLTPARCSHACPIPAWKSILRSRSLFLLGLILLTTKLVLEYHYGPSADTERLIGASVVTAAHRYGALAGIVYVLIWRYRTTWAR